VVFFRILVSLGSRKWELWKRYSQFESLDADLRTKHPLLPKLPGKTFFRLQAKDDISKRREDLHGYLQDIVNRQDLRTNTFFREFLELDT
jgi:PX domain